MDPLSLAVSGYSLASNLIRPQLLRRLGSEPDTFLRVIGKTAYLPSLDIVCIPDLNEDPESDWTKHDGNKSTNWLTDLLCPSFPDARLLLFQYSPRTRTHEGFTRKTIHKQAYELLEHLWKRRRGIAERRPLLFLTHNSGALIARSALIQSSAAFTDRDANLRSIYLSTGAVFVLDAVEKLSESWQDVLGKAISKVPHRMERSKRGSEPEIQSAEWFEWQQDRFRAIASTVATFVLALKVETSETNLAETLWNAAAAYRTLKFLGDHAQVKQLHRQSPELMRYSGSDDPDYVTFVDYLNDCRESGIVLIQAKLELDRQKRSLTTQQMTSFIQEAEVEYDKQLQQTEMIGQQWRGEMEAAINFYNQSNETETESRPRRLSQASIASMRRSLDSGNRNIESSLGFKQLKASIRLVEQDHDFLHARTLECLQGLAIISREIGMLDTSESILQRLLVSWESRFGTRHRKVLNAIQQIADIKVRQARYADASSYLSKALDLRLNLLTTMENKLSNEKEDKKPFDQLTKLESDILFEHEAVARCQVDLAVSYDMQDRFSEAEGLYIDVLRSRKDPADKCRQLCLENQALHYRKMGNLSEATRIYKDVLAAYDSKGSSVSRRDRKIIEDKLKEANDAMARKKANQGYFQWG